ncbi:acyltransferase [Neorhizobium sp. P12A]|jgi:exopolysaccharide production protein ExoZ|uniref:acyltransferase family protein n=1 Tax=Rhizobium/Agrobacterium group TaxID=227290 RepID=UPI00104BF6B2|nr:MULTISPECIES: acyltransferase [Rhizobium/Agrobacterium group]KAA0691418.1 acyltransferase [Neorhizobium sp. P12A]TCR73214.1 exopolysaccharide production protein ExoZ [Rhizobium sp. BK376]
MKTLFGIQYLRAFAALAVVVFHAAERTGGQFRIGAAGVDVFFVISGFIMWVMSARRPVTPLRFAVDRIQRIAPSYWIVTAIMLAGAVVSLFPNMRLTADHILGSFLFIPVRSPSNGEIWPVLVQGWTLNFEMFFYAIFAIALFLPRRFQLPFIGSIFAVLVGLGLWLHPQSPVWFTYTRPIIFEFVAGIVLAQLWLTGKIPNGSFGLPFIAIGLCGFAAIYFLQLDFNEFSCGPLAFALVLGIVSLEGGGKLPSIRPLTYLGNASYSIYLWHTLAISVIAKFAVSHNVPPDVATLLSAILGTIFGVIAYEAVEKPLRTVFKSLSWRRSRPSPA